MKLFDDETSETDNPVVPPGPPRDARKRFSVHRAQAEAQQEKGYQDTVSHLREPYKNAQELVRLLDTKVGVLIGLTSVNAGIVVALLRWYLEAAIVAAGAAVHPIVATVGQGLLAKGFEGLCALSLGFGAACIVACVWAVMPRGRNPASRPFLLYPEHHDDAQSVGYIRRCAEGMSREQIIGEYVGQIEILGRIIGVKLVKQRKAIGFFWMQFLFLALAALLLSVAMFIRF